MRKEKQYLYWLGNVRGVSAAKKMHLLEIAGSAGNLYKWQEKEWQYLPGLSEKEKYAIRSSKRTWDIEGRMEELLHKGIQYIHIQEPDCPWHLREIPAPPFGLYVRGKIPQEPAPKVAMVGAGMCSNYGRQAALEFAAELSRHGVHIVSGLARGIDGYVHKGAVDAGGITLAVLGSGVDICYPAEHRRLYEQLQEKGAVISEYPPGTPPKSSHFPARNRIISGISDVVLVIEAKERSGSLITADMALEQGRDVFALPGRVTDALSTGCNHLIRQGAGLAASPEDLLKELDIFCSNLTSGNKKNQKILETDEDMVYSCLDLHPKNLSELIQELPYTISELTNLLVSLEIKGYIVEISKNYYAKVTSGTKNGG